MTPEELDEATVKEAKRLAKNTNTDAVYHAARLARERWTPPEPVVDPDVLAWREWMANRVPIVAHWYLSGSYDAEPSATAYLAGARMAREQERERAKPLVERFSALVERVYDDARRRKRTGVNASEMISARVALAKYEETAR